MAEVNAAKVKALTIKAIMKNPKMAKTLSEAFSAPIGSTKRAHTKELISIMEKINGKKYSDGQGGAGPSVQQKSTDNSYKNIRIFPAAPSFKQNKTEDGQGGILDWDFGSRTSGDKAEYTWDKNKGYVPNIYNNLKAADNDLDYLKERIVNNASRGSAAAAALFGGGMDWLVSNAYKPKSFTDTTGYKTARAIAADPKGISEFNALMRGGAVKNSQAGYNPQNKQIGPTMLAAGTTKEPSSVTVVDENGKPVVKRITSAPPGIAYPSLSSTDYASDSWSGTGTTGSSVDTGTTGLSEDTVPGIMDIYNTLSANDKKRFADVYKAAAGNMGANTFAFQTMADKAAFKRLFPNVPESSIPSGGSLERSLGDLRNTLIKENHLDTLLNEYNQMRKSGGNIQGDLENYIRGRDTYLEEVNSLIDKTKTEALNDDTSNPAVANKYSSQMNYLYILKGRQNKRYVNFLNTSINEYNTQLDNVKTQYETTLSKVQNDYTTQANIKQADYNMYMTMLQDLYNQVSGMPDVILNRRSAQAQINATSLSQIVDLNKAANGADGKSVFEQAKEYKDYILDKDGNIQPNLSILGMMKKVASEGKDPSGVLDLATMGIRTKLSNASGEEAMSAAKQYYTMAKELSDNGYQEYGQSIISQVNGAIKPKIKEAIVAKKTEIIDAIEDLLGFWKTSLGQVTSESDKSSWMSKHAGIDKGILEGIFRQYKVAYDGSGGDKNKLKSLFFNNLDLEKDFDEVAKILAEGTL